MKHSWSTGFKIAPSICLLCGGARTEKNEDEECPQRPGPARAPRSSYETDPTFYGRVKEVREELPK